MAGQLGLFIIVLQMYKWLYIHNNLNGEQP